MLLFFIGLIFSAFYLGLIFYCLRDLIGKALVFYWEIIWLLIIVYLPLGPVIYLVYFRKRLDF